MRTDFVYDYRGFGALFLPVGGLDIGGTCEFSTASCRKHCWAPCTNPVMERTRDVLFNQPISSTVDVLVKDLAQLQTTQLMWFESGDCPKKQVKRVVRIMQQLSDEGIKQGGFTRNIELWDAVGHIDDVHLCLTIEKFNPDKKWDGRKGMVACPNYEAGHILLYKCIPYEEPQKHYYACGGGWMSGGDMPDKLGTCDPKFMGEDCSGMFRENNCDVCADEGEGCFAL